MPQLGEAVTEGTITRWAKQVGEAVAEDAVLFEVSTDKVDTDVPSPVAGVLSEILVPEGETVDVGTRLAVVTEGAETAPAASTPAAEEPRATAERPSPPSPANCAGKVRSPIVRRLLADHDLDADQIASTGPGGQITRADVPALVDRPGSRAVAFTNIRRRTAEHMLHSQATSAHAMVSVEVDYYAVDQVRAAQRAAFREAEGIGLSYLPFISRALVDVLAEFPHVNASVGEDELILHNAVNLGIAVDLQFDGLLVPVVPDARGKDCARSPREIASVAAKARSKQLGMDDISGGTITLTSLGHFGTVMTVPVINQPQVAIISTDGIRKRPVALELPDGTDAIGIHPVGNLVLSWDHRAFDGAYAAAFLSKVRTVLETRDWSAEL